MGNSSHRFFDLFALPPPRTGRMPEARIRSKLPNRTWIALIALPPALPALPAG